MLYYMYCVKLGRSDHEFWRSTVCIITTMIDIYADEQMMKNSSYTNEPYESRYFNLKKEQQIMEITSMSQMTA